ncbi:MAG: PP2C family protein-serine/threonine phosphatase, partial [Limisphaerales bacterium]
NVLQKALGGGNQFVDPQVGAVGYEPGDIFLLCTDGLTEKIYNEELVELLRSKPSSKEKPGRAQRLVDLAAEKNSRDNATAVVIEVL